MCPVIGSMLAVITLEVALETKADEFLGWPWNDNKSTSAAKKACGYLLSAFAAFPVTVKYAFRNTFFQFHLVSGRLTFS